MGAQNRTGGCSRRSPCREFAAHSCGLPHCGKQSVLQPCLSVLHHRGRRQLNMPLQAPNLDDRRFADLLSEAKTLIPRYTPEWTDHNESDPGIALLELD